VEAVKDSFVGSDLREHFSDLLFRAKTRDGDWAYVYILFEHKSYPDVLVAFQVLRYVVRIWECVLKQGERLSSVFPIVLYHGDARWNVGPQLHDVVCVPAGLEEFTPDFRYWLCDLSRYDDAAIRGVAVLQVGLLVMKYIAHDLLRERLPDIARLLVGILRQPRGLDSVETVLRYLTTATNKISGDDLREAVSAQLAERGEELMATIAEKWVEEGLQRGLQQGMQQGMQQGARQGLLAGLELGLELKFGAEGLRFLPTLYKIEDVDVLRAIHKGLRNADTLEELISIYQSPLC